MFIIGTFLSIIYFIVIPIIPDKKQPNIVTASKIPVLVFSFVLKVVPIAIPILNPAKLPVIASKTISGKLFPYSTFNTKIVYINNNNSPINAAI